MWSNHLGLFTNGKSRVVRGLNKDRVRAMFNDVRSVFKMGVRHG